MDLGENFWSSRYQSGQIGWDLGEVAPPLKAYFDQLEDKIIRILIPGCGNAYEAEYLHNSGFGNVFLVDIVKQPLESFKKRVPDFPEEHLIHGDFFELEEKWNLIIEQTFFSALHADRRKEYALKMKELLKPGGKLVGVLFDAPLYQDRPPFGGSKKQYLPIFESLFEISRFETCYNSHYTRQRAELFINLVNKG